MKRNGFSKTVFGAAVAAGFGLVQGCSTIHSGGEAEDMRLRPLPGALDPAPVEVVEPAVREQAVVATGTEAARPRPLTLKRPQLTTGYTVKAGDSLSGIAYRYKLRWQDVAAVNPSINPNRLVEGEVIQLPGKVDVSRPVRGFSSSASTAKSAVVKATGGNYTVKAGDSLSVIAQRHGVKTADLRKANNLSGDMIRVGQKLVIPGAKAAVVKQTETPPAPPAPVTPPPVPVVEPPPAPAVEPPPAPTLAPLELTPPAAPAAAPGVIETAPVAAPVAAPDAPPAPALPAPATATPPETGYQNHTVAPGEDLYSVAVRWCVGTDAIKAANNLTGSELVPGTVLKIPPAPTAP